MSLAEKLEKLLVALLAMEQRHQPHVMTPMHFTPAERMAQAVLIEQLKLWSNEIERDVGKLETTIENYDTLLSTVIDREVKQKSTDKPVTATEEKLH